MATLTSTLGASFTPAVGDFHVQVTGGQCQLVRRNSSGAAWALAQSLPPGTYVVTNSIAGTDYMVTSAAPVGGTQPIIQVDQ